MFKKLFANKRVQMAIASILALSVIALGLVLYSFAHRGYSLKERMEKVVAEDALSTAPSDSYISDSKVSPNQYYISYSVPVFKVELIDKEITEGVSIHPNIKGKWYISGDRTISFTPETDWIPNTKYKVNLNKSLFAGNVVVKKKDFEFNSPIFKAKVESSSFYEDPRDTKLKQAIATFKFNYPIDETDVENKISIASLSGDKYKFTYKLNEGEVKYKIYVMSEAVKIKKDEDFAEIKVKGVKNIYNSNTNSEITAKIKIPSYSTFFKVNNINSQIIYNENNENQPEQILFVSFSTAVKADALDRYLDVYRYSMPCYKVKEKIGKKEDISKIKGAQKVELTRVNPDEVSSKTHALKYDIIDRNVCLAVKINKGLNSVDEFVLSADEVKTVDSANYPLQSQIAFSGSILSLQGERSLTFTSRGVDKLSIDLSRIRIEEINHLITQTSGDFSHPYFKNYNFNEYNISELFQKEQNVNMEHPAKEVYSSLNLNKYFEKKRGIFLVSLKGSYKNKHYSAQDKRLIVITDLGIIAKDNVDKTHNVYVSSFRDGKPVKGAKVELLGKNGLPVLEAKTNGDGIATFPNFENFTKEKEPVVYLVTKGDDVSFMAVNKSDRKLDYSRFDVGGVYADPNSDTLSGLAFSDRGIYRPGEDAYFGLIIRQSNLKVPNKLPLQVTVRNSTGDEVASSKIWSDEFGLLDYKYSISNTAKVGDYNLYVHEVSNPKNPNFVTSVTFRVEEFTPDNMKIKSKLEEAPSKGWFIGENINASVNLQNLYGNPASHHKVTASYYLSPYSFSFKQYSSFRFNDPLRLNNSSIRSHSEKLDDAETDEKGNVEYTIDLSNFDKGTYMFHFNAQGYELDSGRSVATSSQMLVSPNQYLIGYRGSELGYIMKDSETKIDFIAIDNNLKQITKDNLTIELVALKYVSTLVAMPNGTYRYQMVEKEEPQGATPYQISENGSEYQLTTETPGEYYVIIKDGTSTVAKVYYTVVGPSNTSFKIDRDAFLDIKLNKNEYNHGDKIQMQLKAPYEGYGLITIEQDKVYAYKWFKADSKVSEQTIELPKTVEGNAYINVAFIRSADSKEIFASPLSYAVAPFSVNKDKRRVNITLGVPEVVKPGDELVVKYKTSQPSKVIIYGVNEGILQVAKYQMPDPISYFLKKRALRVVTFQIMDLILPEMKIIRNLKSSGGDDADMEDKIAQHLNPFSRKQNEVVAFWSGVIDSSAEEKEYIYRVPETFNGQITVMSVGVTDDRFGTAKDKSFVRGDFALTPSGPFNVSPGDVFEVGTSVANLVEGSGNNYEIYVDLETSEGLEVVGDKSQLVSLKEKAETSVRYKVRALDRLGSSTLTFKARAKKDDTKASKMPYHIGIRPSSPYTVDLNMGYEPSKLKLKNFVEPMFEEFRKQEIVASTSPMVVAQSLLKFLDKYPHPCTEQTVSKVFPAMVTLHKYPDLVKGIDVYALFDNAISKLTERQVLNGGFSSWSNSSSHADEFSSVYAAHFLTVAKDYNFNVPRNLLVKAINYNKEVAGRTPNSLEDVNVAYAIYVLTLSGETTTNYLVNLEQYYEENYKKEWKSTLSATYMAASYKLLQDEAKARGLLGRYKLGEVYNSINDARYIHLIATHFPDDFSGVNEQGIKSLLEPLRTSNYTTISSAYSLLALNAYQNDTAKDKEITFNQQVGNTELFASLPLTDDIKEMEVKSPNPFFYSVVQQGFLKNKDIKEKKEGLEVYKEYLNKDGKVIKEAKIGDEIFVRIKFRSLSRDYVNDVAIVDLIPGCFEIQTNNIYGDNINYSEEREDRALVYVSASKDLAEVTYKVKVIAKGEFVVPPVYANAMYDALIKANSKASTLNVEE